MSDYFEKRAREHAEAVARQGYPFEGDLSEDQKRVWFGGEHGKWHLLQDFGNMVFKAQTI